MGNANMLTVSNVSKLQSDSPPKYPGELVGSHFLDRALMKSSGETAEEEKSHQRACHLRGPAWRQPRITFASDRNRIPQGAGLCCRPGRQLISTAPEEGIGRKLNNSFCREEKQSGVFSPEPARSCSSSGKTRENRSRGDTDFTEVRCCTVFNRELFT